MEWRVHFGTDPPWRYFSAAFLLVWLIGWAAGEAFVLWLLWVGARSLITGQPPEPGRDSLALAPALVIGLFLLAWLSLWTVGGLLALREFMRLLWARDRLLVNCDTLEVIRQTGLLRERQRFAATDLRRIYRRNAGSVVMAETRNRCVELTRLGTRDEQDEVVAQLSAELQLEPRGVPPVLPPGWSEIRTPSGDRLVVKDPAARRRQFAVATLLALVVGSVAAVTWHAASANAGLVALAVIVTAASLALAWGAWSLGFTRREWRLTPGRILAQRRVGSRVRDLFSADTLVLEQDRDGDGDIWYSAYAVDSTALATTPRVRRRARRTLLRQMHDDAELRRLLEWLSAATNIPVTDRTQPETKALDLAALAAQLENTGGFGRWIARTFLRRDRRS